MFFYKTPAETRKYTVSFADSLLSSETILSSGLTLSITNIQTSGISTSSLYVASSLGFTGTDVYFRLQAGDDDSVYRFVLSAGVTASGNTYSKKGSLYVTDDIQYLVDLDELKDYLSITTTTTDAVLISLLRAATSFVTRYIGRDLTYQQYTETIYPEQSWNQLRLTNFPVDAVESVVVDGTTLDATTAGYANYVVEKEGYIRRVDGGSFPRGSYATTVVYRAGFKAIPEDIRTVVKKLVGNNFNKRQQEGILEEELGSYRVVYDDKSAKTAEDSSVRDVLNLYVSRVI